MLRTLFALSFSASLAVAQFSGTGGYFADVPVTPPSITGITPLGLVNGNYRYQILGSNFGSGYAGGVCLAHARLYDAAVNSFIISSSLGNNVVVICDPLAPVVWTDTMVAFDAPALPGVFPFAPAALANPFLVLTTNSIDNPRQISLSATFPIPRSILATSVTYAPSITVHPPTVTEGSAYSGTCTAAGAAPVSPNAPPINPAPIGKPTGGGSNGSQKERRGKNFANNLIEFGNYPCVSIAGSGFGQAEPLIIPSIHMWARIDSTGAIFFTSAQPAPNAPTDLIFEMWNPFLNYSSYSYTSPDNGVEKVVVNSPSRIVFTEKSSFWPVSVATASAGPITLGYVVNETNGLISSYFSFRPVF